MNVISKKTETTEKKTVVIEPICKCIGNDYLFISNEKWFFLSLTANSANSKPKIIFLSYGISEEDDGLHLSDDPQRIFESGKDIAPAEMYEAIMNARKAVDEKINEFRSSLK